MRRRSGFTLVETVVTVGLIAVLASFVIPSVMRKADAADPVKVANDLNSVSTAVEEFESDTKAFPGEIEQLTQPILTNSACNALQPCDSTITHAAIFTTGEAQLWKGPYLDASIERDPSSALRSGYVADISNVLVRFDAVNGVPEWCPSVGNAQTPCAGFVSTNPLFVAVRVTGLDSAQAVVVNGIIDGRNETRPGLLGRFRFATGGSPAYYLAAPMP